MTKKEMVRQFALEFKEVEEMELKYFKAYQEAKAEGDAVLTKEYSAKVTEHITKRYTIIRLASRFKITEEKIREEMKQIQIEEIQAKYA